MAQVAYKNDVIESNIENGNEDINNQCVDESWKDSSTKGIIKSISWIKSGRALQYSLKSFLASAIIGGILYIYGYGINQLISYVIG